MNRDTQGSSWVRYLSLTVLIAGLGLLGSALWIPVKAEVAQALLQRAWQQTQASGHPQKPWPWADHTTIARLQVPAQGIDQILLAGDSGAVLAFAPGENMQARLTRHGARIISGHRDTHFRFLEYVQPGTAVVVTGVDGVRHYRVTHTQIANAKADAIDPRAMPGGLVLVTCYPFDALQVGGSERYLVFAQAVDTI